ncbi:hypothetical protein [Pseudonocardia alaniniphila]|uniref:ABC-2 type transport system permease protein n=1 Tax=Pseudonocardia alaniniphila TaxID=75291 RepID=A0ABS9THG9_9PSEU|nr:hypothetical protein [Pseudonocardia alaniniphila]MCH6167957.1 hypothetical protein [Pseudonocardia alaniniphila]
MKRVFDVARIQTVNWFWIFAFPPLLLFLVLVLNVGLFAAIGDVTPPEGRTTGAVLSIYMVMLMAHLQTMTQVFPFALGLSVTRRAFYAGTGLVVGAQSVLFGLLLLVMGLIETATGGWGTNLKFFAIPFLIQDNLLAQWLVYTVPFVALSAIGVFIGVVFKRWGQPGVYALTVGTVLVLAGAAIVVTWQRWWPAVGSFFTDQSIFSLLVVYPLVIALVLGGGGWLAIRRATP